MTLVPVDAPVASGGPSLWRNRAYMSLLTGETISAVGVQVAQVAMPIIAVTYLAASEMQVGVLGAVPGLAFLALSLPVGAWVDRVSRRGVMVAANLVRSAVMATVPLLWWLGVLEMTGLVVAALALSAAQVFFDMSYMSMVPSLVRREQLDDANARLQITAETARAAGPGLGGLLAKALAAPLLTLAATVGYLASAIAIWRIPRDVPPPRREARLIGEMREGVSFVLRNIYIRPVVVSATVSNLFATLGMTMVPVLLLRELEMSATAYGLLLSCGSLGGILGAVSAPWFGRRFGQGHAIPVTYLIGGIAFFAMPLALHVPRAAAIALIGAGELVVVFSIVAFNVVQVSMRQRQCPPRMIGRMTASIRTLMWGVGPLGALGAGVLATHLGLAATFWIAAVGNLAGIALLVRSPLWRLRTVPDPAWLTDPAHASSP
ncbi:MFS transporter [Demequina pelophila]|uniref:MFS transporter n=1 Tax=Demequina pelophila TaxID=1638984 RepID=UPI000782FD98|nr:MFS transporter [Demequina pelophila]